MGPEPESFQLRLDETDGRSCEPGLTLNHGSVIRIVEMLPSGISPMQRTNSIYYDIVLSGKVELELDGGAASNKGSGNIIAQRGTMHF